MRLTFILLTSMVVLYAHAQTTHHTPGGTIIHLDSRQQQPAGGNRDVIFQEDFADGIPTDWLNAESNGIAHWEYRGLNTTPNLETGTQGSCLPAGTTGQPIQSPTQGNGFVIFDSNWWDNPDLPCTPANFGTGSAPGPHYATLASPIIDLTNYYGVGLEFYQYYNGYDVHASVELSADGGITWFEIYNNDLINNPSDLNDHVLLPIGQYVGGLSEVKFRFVFTGLYYFWQIDDVNVIEIPEFDVAITEPSYGDFDIYDPAHPTGFEFMEYSRYPYQMAPLLKFSATAVNNGVYENYDVRLNVEIKDPTDNVIHSAQSLEGLYVWPGVPQEVRAGTFQNPSVLGEYSVHQYLTTSSIENLTDNNHDTTFFQIHEVQYARDRLFASSVYFPTEEFNDVPYEIGNVFLNSADNMNLYSLSVGLGIGTTLPCTVYGALYEISITNELDVTLIATTSAIDVTNSMLNGYADQIMTTLEFDQPIALENGKAYLAMAGSVEGGNFMVCALAGDAPEFTSWVHFLPNEWRLVSMMPMVRMNFGAFDNVNESNVELTVPHVYPNPTNSTINYTTERSFDGQVIRITDCLGREIHRELATYPLTSIDVTPWTQGMYFLYSDKSVIRFFVE
jgi:hypothetical protein